MNALFNHRIANAVAVIVCLYFATTAFGGLPILNSTSKIGDEIDPQVRSELNDLNAKLVRGLIQRNSAQVLSMMSAPLLVTVRTKVDLLVPQISRLMKSKKHMVQWECHSVCIKPESPMLLSSGKSVENQYSILVPSITKESYASMLSISEAFALLVVYGKYDDHWRIDILRAGRLKMANLSGPDYFKLAKSRFASKDTIDALLYSAMATQLLHPFAATFSYDIQDEVEKFQKQILGETSEKYKLPLTVNAISSRPIIFELSPHVVNDTVYPMISYHTKLSFDDTAVLRQEFEIVKNQTNATFKGIHKTNNTVFYRAFTKSPDGSGVVESYGFTDKQK